MNPIPQEKPLAIIGSIHAENGKIFHVHSLTLGYTIPSGNAAMVIP